MSETKLQIVIDAQNRTNAGFQALKRQLDVTKVSVQGVSDAMKTVGKVGTVALTGLTAFVATSVRSYGEAQVAMAKVDATLKAMGKTSADTKNKILEASQAVVRLGFDDEAAAVSITKLYQRTGDLNEAIRLNSLAMDLARAKSIDLSTASQMISLVMSGNARALKEYGIELDETKGPMAAIAQLQQVVAGQAEAATSSITVQGEVLRETFSNLQDTIGKQFAPVVTQALQTISPFVEKLGQWVEQNPELAKRILLTAAAMTALVAVMLPLGMALPGIVLAFQGLVGVLGVMIKVAALAFTPMGSLVVVLGLIGFAVYKVSTQWQDAWDVMTIAVSESANVIQIIIEKVVNYIIDSINAVISRINSLISKLASIPKIGDKFKDLKLPTLDAFQMQRFDTGAVYNQMMDRPSSRTSGGVTVNVTGNNFLDQFGAEQIGDLIMSKLKLSNAL